jgi:hypothetical protein
MEKSYILAECGIMLRSSTAANAQTISIGSGPPQGGNVTAIFGVRPTDGGTYTGGAWGIATPDFPAFLRLVRAGNVLTGYISVDGTTWDTTTTFGSGYYGSLTLPATMVLGMYVESYSTTTLETDVIDTVTITQP